VVPKRTNGLTTSAGEEGCLLSDVPYERVHLIQARLTSFFRRPNMKIHWGHFTFSRGSEGVGCSQRVCLGLCCGNNRENTTLECV